MLPNNPALNPERTAGLTEKRPASPAASAACPEQSAIAALLDDELPNDLRDKIEQHVDGCPTCLESLALLADQREQGADPTKFSPRGCDTNNGSLGRT